MSDTAKFSGPIYPYGEPLPDDLDLSKPFGIAGPPPSDEPTEPQDWTGWQEVGAIEDGDELRTIFGRD